MPTKFKQDDGQIVWVSHVPDWEANPEGGFYSHEVLARACEREYEARTGERVKSDAMLGQLIERNHRAWHKALSWNHGLVPVFYLERKRWATHKEREWRRKNWGTGEVSTEATVTEPAAPVKRHPFSPEMKDQIWLRTSGHCAYCGLPLMPFTNFTVDHVHPVSDGGTDEFSNLVPCCKTCNSRKHAMPVETFRLRCGGGQFWIEKNGGAL